jgi:hypothetical protein
MKCFLLVLIATSLMGCQVWLDVDAAQCTRNADCVGILGRGYTCEKPGICVAPREPDAGKEDAGEVSQLPTRWACVTEPLKNFIPDPDRMVTIRMDAVDLNTLKVPQGIHASACSPGDVECSAPIIDNIAPGSDGFFEFTVPHGFEGFLSFTSPTTIPALSFTNRAYLDNLTTSGPALSTPSALEDIASHAGRPNDPSRGVAILEVRDCNDRAGDGVAFDPVGDEMPFYFDGALPARGLTATTISNLLGAGREPRAVGGFSNLMPGYLTFEGRLEKTGESVGRVTVQIRAGWFTYVRFYAGG